MATLSSKLVLSLVDRVTAPARSIATTVGRLNAAQKANAAQMNAMRGQMLGAGAAGYALARAISSPIKAAVAFESAMADVRKVVDFKSPAAFQNMSQEIIDLSTKLPIAAKGIADIVAAAGQAGMKGEELMEFATLAAKVGVAFDMSAGQTGEALAKIKTQLGYSVSETGLLADALNHLSNTSASSAPDLIDYMKRVASIGKQAGFSAAETAAIGSAMVAAGAESNVAATSFRNITKALQKGSAATKNQRKAYAALGLDSNKIAKSMQKDAVGTLNKVIEKIRALPAHMRASTISQLFGDEARAIMPLVENAGLLEKALASVSTQANYLNSSQKEYERRASTTEAAMQRLSNQMTAASIAIGEALIPAMNGLMSSIAPVLKTIRDLALAHPALTRAIVATAAGLVALRVAAIAAKFAFFWTKGGIISGAIVGLTNVGIAAAVTGGALKALALVAASPFKLLIAAAVRARAAMIGFAVAAKIGGIGTAMSIGLRAGAASLLSMLNPLKLVTAAMRVLKLAVIGTGIGAILVAIAVAGTAIYNNWSGIKAMFQGFGSAFMAAIGPVRPALEPIISLASRLSTIWGALTGKLSASDGDWKKFGESAGRAVGDVVRWFAELPGRIIAAVGSIDLTSMISWPSPPAWWTKLFGSDEKSATPKPVANDNISQLSGEKNPAGGFTQLMGQAPEKVRGDMSSVVEEVRAGGAKASVASKAAGVAVVAGLSVVATPQIDTSSIDRAAAKITALKANIRSMPGASTSSGIAGARAAGGNVVGGSTYLVGEEGPELVTPTRGGYVNNATDTAGMLGVGSAAAKGGGTNNLSSKVIVNINQNISDGTSAQEVAQEAVRIIVEETKGAIDSLHTDLEWT